LAWGFVAKALVAELGKIGIGRLGTQQKLSVAL
jgi:hypothetical protein